MIRKQKNQLFNFLLILLLVACVSFCIVMNKGDNVPVLASLHTNELINEYYLKGSSLVLPDATITVEGEDYPVNQKVLIYPDGTIRSSNIYELSDVGVYCAIYSTDVKGMLFTEKLFFNVYETLFEVSSIFSSATFTNSLIIPNENDEGKGLSVSLSDGDSLMFNKAVDLSKTDGLNEFLTIYTYSCSNAIDGMATKSDVEEFYVRLTDCYDDSKYVDYLIFYYDNPTYGRIPYFRGNANGQTSIGIEKSNEELTWPKNRKEVYLDGIRYIARLNEYGLLSSNKNNRQAIKFGYDINENRLYVTDRGYTKIINDIDNPDIYEENVFEGFTTGEVYVSIFGKKYINDRLRFEITEFNGMSGEELKTELVKDTEAPSIIIEKEVENVAIVLNEKFKVFNAKAFDTSNVSLSINVYRNYGTAQQTHVSLDTENCFVPKTQGSYSVVYSAIDGYGNKTEKIIRLNAVKRDDKKTITFTTIPLNQLKAGKVAKLNEFEAFSINGDVDVNIYALHEANREKKIEIDKKTLEFLPLCVGKYEIFYEYKDIINQYIYSYEVDCVESDAVLFLDDILTEHVFIKGMKYDIEPVYAYTFNGQIPTANLCEFFVSADGGEYKKANYYSCVFDAQESVKLKFSYQGIEYETEPIKVCSVGFEDEELDFKKYFLGDVNITSSDSSITMKTNSAFSDVEIIYANVISLDKFAFEFKVLRGMSGFSQFDIVLTDYYDRDYKYVMTYHNDNGTKSISSNGGNKTILNKFQFADLKNSVSYKSSTKEFIDVSEKVFIDKANFTADKVILSFAIRGVVSDSALEIYKINNQNFNSYSSDTATPSISVPHAWGRYEPGTEIMFKKPSLTDVITSIVWEDVKFTINKPSGGYAVSIDDVLLDGTQSANRDFSVCLQEYGVYRVRYVIKDQNGNTYNYSYPVNVVDEISPTLVIGSGYNKETVISADLGDKVNVEKATVTDNISSNLKVFVTVFAPNGQTFNVPEGHFIANEFGTYKIMYACIDDAGNFVSTYYCVMVK